MEYTRPGQPEAWPTMRVLSVIFLVLAVGTGLNVFASPSPATPVSHAGFVLAVAGFLICLVTLIMRGASAQLDRHQAGARRPPAVGPGAVEGRPTGAVPLHDDGADEH